MSMKKTNVQLYKWSLKLKIIKLYYIKNAMFRYLLHIILIKGNKWTYIKYNINYIKIFKWLKKNSLP